jgi:NTE family protein
MRGLAHVGVLEVLLGHGFRVTEVTGTSVGALIAVYYAVVGLRPDELARVGTGLRLRHLLVWALLRRLPESARALGTGLAGEIPEFLGRLQSASFARLQHGVKHVGIVLMDAARRELLVCHATRPIVPLEDATRGAVAVPGLFPPRRCRIGERHLELMDAGALDNLPVDALLRPPFEARQILAVDVARTNGERVRTQARIERLRREHPDVPIAVVYPPTLGRRTFLSKASAAPDLVEAGRMAAAPIVG